MYFNTYYKIILIDITYDNFVCCILSITFVEKCSKKRKKGKV